MDQQNPIFKPFQRLKDAHRLWHRAEAEYHEPEAFRLNLNSCIQELRNVTFLLQKQKSKIPDFEKHYGFWQEFFRKDLVLKWLHQARNRIVKESDLETKSIARVYFIRSYLDDPCTEFEINPMKSLDEVPNDLELDKLPKDILENGYLKIERRWISSDLPTLELLEALKMGCFAMLLCLDYFYKKCSGEKPGTLSISCGSDQILQGDLNSPPSEPTCMVLPGKSRSVLYKLKDASFATIIETPQKLIPGKEVLKHYGQDFYKKLPKLENHSIRALADYFFSIGKQMLQIDGYHSLIVILIYPSDKFSVHELRVDDQADKYVVWKNLAEEVQKNGAEMVISISESWFAPYDPNAPHRPAKDSPDRKEALQLAGASKNGEDISLTCKFERNRQGEIILGNTEEDSSFKTFFLEPIKKVWRRE